MAAKKRWTKNKYILGLLIFVMLSAGVHILFLLIYILKTFDFSKSNYFRILQMDLLFPGLNAGLISYVASLVIALFGYLTIVLLLHQRGKVQS